MPYVSSEGNMLNEGSAFFSGIVRNTIPTPFLPRLFITVCFPEHYFPEKSTERR